MARLPRNKPNTVSIAIWIGSLIMVVAFAAALVSRSGSGSGMSNGGTATVHVSITDPPSCKFPNGDFQHVYVTIRSVQAHTAEHELRTVQPDRTGEQSQRRSLRCGKNHLRRTGVQ
jgi:type 1 fimbria pilin